ncbi:NADP-dependent glyceraldehyde-3-phosphate dehydrogenase [Clostridium sp. E02]|uniref:NADP-dependent glyceraldehyde-3-phosphate dehydrogenase n=1 Tax=Clostridium sp. E02 TaxID=2487134 RepID=UPI000F51B108|nr:NADP-dependent glyceraldehyde-3-phosphate dehydrogenase [Clostridium sp. E02]
MLTTIKNDKNQYRNLINGQWVESQTGTYMDIKSPIGGSVLGSIPAMSKEEVDSVVQIAREAQKKWREITIDEKAEMLYRVSDVLLQHIEEFTELLVREIAKDRKSCRSEIERTADFIRFTADTGKNISGESIPGDSFPGGKHNKISIVRREPLGVVLAISPFNYPINLAASKIAPGLMAGNSVILKPATQGSLSGLYLAGIFKEAGLPAGVLNTITGKGSEIGDYITTHKGIDFINFTGSTEVGTHISGITSMVPLLMELGGKDAAIVLEDADLELTAKNIVAGGYSYSGQRCTAVKRILVIDSVADQLIGKIIPKIEKLRAGNPVDEEVEIVPLISSKAADFVCELMEDAKEKGAVLLTGGKREGNLIEPTLFDRVTTDMRLAWEEPFGPVLPIIRVKDKDQAIEIANASEYGLQSAVFTQNINQAFYVADRLEVGTVQINNKTERGPDHFPFLGVKASGIGTQGIRYSIESMSRPKVTVINVSDPD